MAWGFKANGDLPANDNRCSNKRWRRKNHSRNWPSAMGGDGRAAASHQATAVIHSILKESSLLLSENGIISSIVLGS